MGAAWRKATRSVGVPGIETGRVTATMMAVGGDAAERRRVKPAVAAAYYDIVKSIKRWNASKPPLSRESHGRGAGKPPGL